ncbi:hypothetical protein NY99_09260 [Xanthomonas phaseoli pv. phaseoli]|uniref:Uncharacterized protein n=3 Tax=Xanthomonas TaxID=338 RepID=A0AB34Q3Q9_XANCI|nr:hypothetical protein XAC29_06470 [Xanthomonas axonopodis Xac29-1]AKM24454.1 hypothetical protein AB890_06570 [Xanthomonas citri pv. citri]AMU99264.1 hypothetical protein TP37_15115 [Xanthomonas citri pv. aurantifolii]AZU16748.1 hypothetical protein AC613_06555 [Xanthomonas citri pv. fuscans]KGP32461.1 hypothetical protein NY65_04545 [Xanthomonas phaseoli pv. phaseoli]MBZ3924239.1 hypothetical protein [Xanthomonas citri pv. sesbaniae]OOW68178.1 hypothetical protein Xmlh_14455 [Xanthomonas a
MAADHAAAHILAGEAIAAAKRLPRPPATAALQQYKGRPPALR